MEGRPRPAPQATLNRWIIGETARVRAEVDAALEAFRFNDAAGALYAFVWGKVCDWYVEFSKPLLAEDHPERAETQATMAWVLDQCLLLLHPFMPFVTEELWGLTAERAKPLVHADWPDHAPEALADPAADAEIAWAIALIEEVRSLRVQMGVPAGAKVPMLRLTSDETARAAWEANAPLIQRLARIESLEDAAEAPKGAVTIPAQGATFALPLAGLIDVAAEGARLDKALDKLAKETRALEGRLSNPKFVESAPEDVVAETRDNLDARRAEAEKLAQARERLRAMA